MCPFSSVNHIRRKPKVDKSRSTYPLSKGTTTCDSVPVKKHKSTPDLKGLNLIKDMNANSRCPPSRDISPASAESFVRASSQRTITDCPTIILVVDDNWDSSSTDFPLKRVDQIIPTDITDVESSECSSHPNIHFQRAPQRRQIVTGKSSQERWFKNHMHDPDASFLDMNEKTKSKYFWIWIFFFLYIYF